MHEIYSDDFASLGGGRAGGLIPERLRRTAGALVFVGLVVGMGVWAYRLGTRDAAEVPIIRAMEGPARIQPEDPGGEQAAHQGLEVNTVLSGEPAPVPRDVPAAEALVAEALLAEEDAPLGELRMTAVPPPADFAGASGGTELPVPRQEDIEGADFVEPAPDLRSPEEIAAALDPEGALLAEDEPREDLAPVGLRPRSRPTGLVVARAAPVRSETAAEISTAPATPPTSAPAPVAPPAREVASVPSGSRMVQLGAFDSEGITRQAWANLVSRHGDLLGSKSLYVERTTANARVFYRLRVAGFDSTAETGAMCQSLRSRGIDCIPVTLN